MDRQGNQIHMGDIPTYTMQQHGKQMTIIKHTN